MQLGDEVAAPELRVLVNPVDLLAARLLDVLRDAARELGEMPSKGTDTELVRAARVLRYQLAHDTTPEERRTLAGDEVRLANLLLRHAQRLREVRHLPRVRDSEAPRGLRLVHGVVR